MVRWLVLLLHTLLMCICWLLLLAAVHCGLLMVEHEWSRGHVTSSAAAASPLPGRHWNILPEQLRRPGITYRQFKRSLYVWLAGPRRRVAKR